MPGFHLRRDGLAEFLQLREVPVIRADAARQLPDPLDGVELRAVRREEEEPQHLPVRREERGESAGMVVCGVIIVVVDRKDCATVLEKSIDRKHAEEKKAEQLKAGISSVQLNKLEGLFAALGLVED